MGNVILIGLPAAFVLWCLGLMLFGQRVADARFQKLVAEIDGWDHETTHNCAARVMADVRASETGK